jgi:hypothetical protein
MELKIYRWLSVLAALALLSSACGTAAPDASAIATSAVQTVEARYTAQAAQTPSPAPTQPPQATATLELVPSQPALQPTQPPVLTPPTPRAGGVPCLSANYVADITISDYAIVTPGAKFTKTWQVKNTGSCPWDAGYKLVFDTGDAMGSVTSFALPQVVYQDQVVNISIELTAPSTAGVYKGYWKLATPFGGTIGFGQYNAPLSVIITSSTNTKKEFAVVTVTYDPIIRAPLTGCPAAGAVFTLTAYVSVNAPGEVTLHWARNPDDGSKPEYIKLNFKEAGTKSVTYDWRLKPEAVPGDRWLAVFVDSPNNALFDKVPFNFACP